MFYIFPYKKDTGELYKHPYYGTEQAMNVPIGYEVLPAIVDTDATAQAAYRACEEFTSWKYVVQNGTLVQNPNLNEIELDQAKATQTALIEMGFAQTLLSGFASSADGTARTYASDKDSLQEIGWVRDVPQTSYPAEGIEAKLVDGSHVMLNYAQMQTLTNDVQSFFLSARSKRISLIKQIQQIEPPQTVADVQAVTW